MDYLHRQPTSIALSESRPDSQAVDSEEGEQHPEGMSEYMSAAVDAAEENRLPCSMVIGYLLATFVVLGVAVSAAVYVPPLQMGSDEINWWKTSVIYQIYPRSFKDSDANGIGDIPGQISLII